jgi:hypothetical protein
MKSKPGGGYPENVDAMIKLKCQEAGVPIPKYIQIEKGGCICPDCCAMPACVPGCPCGVKKQRSPEGDTVQNFGVQRDPSSSGLPAARPSRSRRA